MSLASLIMSLESVFSSLFGWLILHQLMSGKEITGCVLIFSAVLLAQIPSKS
ncbi:EamA family transporter [Butyrivibrio sp. JL13D10]|uniref:EamA family transporter n=1 Tax=Butyrivibrio sp. JL13D10 TaxID=3236815 RepID=UPI0038B63AA4